VIGETSPVEIRVLSYNVRSLRDDRAALLRVISGVAPDVLCVQESPRFFGWRRAAAGLARDTGMRVVCGGADASGNLLLAGERLLTEHSETLFLRHRRGLHLRGMAIAVLAGTGEAAGTAGGPRFTIASTHLSLDEGQRRQQVGEVLGHLDRVAEDRGTQISVLCGDLNSHPDSAEWAELGGRLDDAWRLRPVGEEFTSTARDPHQRIDAVFVTKGITVVRAGVPVDLVAEDDLAVASDHRPVLAVLEI
jgi:endonuclease/exonuclease/phosphatase family metal-dependent hydrolase